MKTNTKAGKGAVGPIIGIIVIVILILLGAFYFWSGKMPVSQSYPETQTASVAPLSPSDDLNSIEGDLNVTDPGPSVPNLN